MHTRLDTIKAAQRAQSFAWNATRGVADAAQQSVDAFVRAIALAKAAGADAELLEDVRILLLDEIFARIQGEINRTLDGNGAITDLHQIDLSELRS